MIDNSLHLKYTFKCMIKLDIVYNFGVDEKE